MSVWLLVGVLGACGDDADDSAAPSSTRAVGTASASRLADLAYLPEDELCELSSSEITDLAGVDVVEDPVYTTLEGLGSSCLYYGDGDTAAVRIEIPDVAFRSLAQLYLDEGGGLPGVTQEVGPCSLGDAVAVCVEPADIDGAPVAAAVIVALGADDDPALLVEAPTSIAARALAVQMLGRLDVDSGS